MSTERQFISWAVPGTLLISTIAVGALLAASPIVKEQRTNTGAVYILGPARNLLSEGLYERADLYFHKGAPHKKKQAFENNIFQQWEEKIHPTEHAHAEGREIAEVMPWLRLATKSNPHNVEAYLVASYWLNGTSMQPDLALGVMDEAIEKNPDRYELYLEKSRVYLGMNQLGNANKALEKALELIILPEQKDPDQAALDLAFILNIQSYLYEAMGQQEQAIRATQTLLMLKPDQADFALRLEALRAGPLNPKQAQQKLEKLFVRDHDHDHEHDHEHHEE